MRKIVAALATILVLSMLSVGYGTARPTGPATPIHSGVPAGCPLTVHQLPGCTPAGGPLLLSLIRPALDTGGQEEAEGFPDCWADYLHAYTVGAIIYGQSKIACSSEGDTTETDIATQLSNYYCSRLDPNNDCIGPWYAENGIYCQANLQATLPCPSEGYYPFNCTHHNTWHAMDLQSAYGSFSDGDYVQLPTFVSASYWCS